MASIKDIKGKVLNAMQEIDLSKLSIDDLQKYVSILYSLSYIAKDKEVDDFYTKAMDKMVNMCCTFEPKTIGDMKGE
jgi:hypothetical protein